MLMFISCHLERDGDPDVIFYSLDLDWFGNDKEFIAIFSFSSYDLFSGGSRVDDFRSGGEKAKTKEKEKRF